MTEAQRGFTQYFFGEMAVRMGLAFLAMAASFAGGWIGDRTGDDWQPFTGAMTGLVLGCVVAVLLYRRRGARSAQEPDATGRDGSATHSLHEPG